MAILELRKNSKEKDAEHRLVVRFNVKDQTYRVGTGLRLTERQWQQEQKVGYPNTKKAVELEQKIRMMVPKIDPLNFDLSTFQEAPAKATSVTTPTMTAAAVRNHMPNDIVKVATCIEKMATIIYHHHLI